MSNKTAQLLAVVAGVALIVVYSVVMMVTEGSSGLAWILLVLGIAMLVGGGWSLRGGPSS